MLVLTFWIFPHVVKSDFVSKKEVREDHLFERRLGGHFAIPWRLEKGLGLNRNLESYLNRTPSIDEP